MTLQRVLRIRDVAAMTGLSRATIYRKMAEKTFPRPVKPTDQTVGWREQDVADWIASLPTAPMRAA